MSIEENVRQYVASKGLKESGSPEAPAERGAQLSVVLGPDEGKTYRFTQECVIGRAADATVRLVDRGVSMHHARVRRLAGDSFVLEDLASRNGTLLNGQAIEQAALESGARIQLGPRCLLLFSLHDDLQQSLMQAKKVEIIGRLSAGLNHDFNNLLCVILANSAYLLELPGEMSLDDAEVRECLEDIRAAAQAGSEVTSRLSTLAQSTSMAQESIDFSSLCEETLEIMRGTYPKTIRIVALVQPGIRLRGARAHLLTLLLNPCLNALDAMPDGGTLTLEAVVRTREEFGTEPALKADAYVVLSFTDTGRGMAPEILRSAFEPFFTTKELELGKGLGLSAVRKVASDHGGTAHLSSRPGFGTTLRVVLPLTDEADALLLESTETTDRIVPHDADQARDARTAQHTAESIARPTSQLVQRRLLLAEDDDGLGRALVRCLRREGYEVTWVTQLGQAIDALATSGEQFDLMLFDMEGSEAARHGVMAAFRRRHANTPMVVFSTESRESDSIVQGGLDIVVRKPVEPAMLVRIVAVALRRHRSGSRKV